MNNDVTQRDLATFKRLPLTQLCFDLSHDVGGVDADRVGDRDELDHIEAAGSVLYFRQIRRGEAEAGGDVGLFEAGVLARLHQHPAEDDELAGEFGLGGDAAFAAMRFHGAIA